MGLEAIDQDSTPEDLNPAWPEEGDQIQEGNEHIQNIKKVLKNIWPNLVKVAGSTIKSVALKSYDEPPFDASSGDFVRANGGIQRLTLAGDTIFTWALGEGQKMQLYLASAGFNVTDWGVDYWMTDVPTLGTENMVIVEKVGGKIYAWDGGSRT